MTSLSDIEEDSGSRARSSDATTKKKITPIFDSPEASVGEKATVINHARSAKQVHDLNRPAFASPVKPGDIVLRQYRLVSQIGAGGMGAVFLAKDDVSGQEVAIKCLPANAAQNKEMLERFTQEARALAALDHKNIVPLVSYSIENEDRFLVMKYVKGESVDALIERHRQLPFSQIEDIIRALLEALGYAHSHGVIHRDVKPANVLITSSNQIYLVDFGIAKREEDMKLTQTGNLVGTPLYMSPEQITGKELDGRSDLYAAGILLYEMITGQHPYAGKTPFAILRAHVENPPPNPVFFRDDPIPPHIDYLLQCLLEKSREERPKSAEAALQLFEKKEESGRMGIARNAAYYADRETPATSFLQLDDLSEAHEKSRQTWTLPLLLVSLILTAIAFFVYSQQDMTESGEPALAEDAPVDDGDANSNRRFDMLIEEAQLKLSENDVASAVALLEMVSTKKEIYPPAESLLLDIHIKAGSYKKAKRSIARLEKQESLPPQVVARLNEQRDQLEALQSSRKRKRTAKRQQQASREAEPAKKSNSASSNKDNNTSPDSLQQGSPQQAGDEGLSYQQIQSVTGLDKNKKMLSTCWTEHVLTKDRYARGNVRLVLTIQNNGRVSKSRIDKDNVGHPGFLECIRQKTTTWVFPSFKGGPEEVDYMAAFQGEIPPASP